MKKVIYLLFGVIAFTSSNAQTIEDFFSGYASVAWLGIDYSNVQLKGNFSQFEGLGDNDVQDIQAKFFPAWNELIVYEPDKYDIKKIFKLGSISYEINMIMKLNAEADSKKMLTYNPAEYDEERINEIISNYSLENKDGLGLCFVAETLDKVEELGYYHVVVINLKTKQVLMSERVKGEPGGFGIKNYWAGSIYNALKAINKGFYKQWKTKYQ